MKFSAKCLALLLVSATLPSMAGTAGLTGKVTRILLDDQNYGGCMAFMNPGPQSLTLNCGNDWVSFDCTGDFHSKSIANQMFSAAQLAYITDSDFRVKLNDAELHNGFCVAYVADNQ